MFAPPPGKLRQPEGRLVKDEIPGLGIAPRHPAARGAMRPPSLTVLLYLAGSLDEIGLQALDGLALPRLHQTRNAGCAAA